jgi:putative membrane protein
MAWFGYWSGGGHGFWWVWALAWVLLWAVVIAFGVWAVLTVGRRSNSDGALDILKRRLAAGEISREDYDRLRRAMQG